MLEVVFGGRCHPQPLHESFRTLVDSRCERNDLLQSQVLETETQGQSGRFQCIAVAPKPGVESPPYLDAGCKGGLETGFGQASKTSKFPIDVHNPKTPAAVIDRLLESLVGGERLL